MSLSVQIEATADNRALSEVAYAKNDQPRRAWINRRRTLTGLLTTFLSPSIRAHRLRAKDSLQDVPLIVLDPGHGGHDPGAIGVTGLFEKHVALTTALQLKTALTRGGRYRVILTRNDDIFIPLEQRTAYARALNARLFVSLHADALTDHDVRGASVYTRSLHASDAQSDELARRENSADPTAIKEYSNYSPEVASILESLAERETRVLSARLQTDLVKSLSEEILMLHNPNRRADFVVLRSSDVPSVLVEMGFMSNKADEMLLQTATHQKQVVAALQHGIETCVNNFSVLTQAG